MKGKTRNVLPICSMIILLLLSSAAVGGKDGSGDKSDAVDEILYNPDIEPMSTDDVGNGVGAEIDRRDESEPVILSLSGKTGESDLPSFTMKPVNAKTFIAKTSSETRASDEEKETGPSDFGNGSVFLRPNDSVTGTLTFDPVNTENMDFRDWFKLDADDVDPEALASGGTILADFSVNSYSSVSTMYEFSVNETGSLVDYYADFLRLIVFYRDIAGGFKYIGGTEFLYDDGVDSDGWYHDDNWTFDFETPIPSYTDEDTDGFTDGLTEWGWYYIGLAWDFYITQEAPDRDGFTIDYTFSFNTGTRNDTDEAGNDWWNATAELPDDEKLLDSQYEQIDWYELAGSDSNKHWNITFVVNRTFGLAGVVGNEFWDTFVHVLFIYYWWGEDEEWNTDDDGWRLGIPSIICFGLTGGIYSNYSVGWYLERPVGEIPFRQVFVGIYVEPMVIVGEGQDFSFRDPYFTTMANYTLWTRIVEEIPNNPPSVSDLVIESDYTQREVGGNYDSMFNFSCVYTDPDNDPPENLLLFIDPDTQDQIEIDMLRGEVDTGDDDYTDGKEYRMSLMGDEIGESETPHIVRIYATDMMGSNSLRISRPSPPLYNNVTLLVWDDNPVYLYDQWNGIEPISEDDPAIFIYLNYLDDGPFADPENDFSGFRIRNATTGEWDTSFDNDLLHIDVVDDGFGSWHLLVKPKLDQSGEAEITLLAEDEHSSISLTTGIEVRPVNDPPVVRYLEYDGSEYPVEYSLGRYYIDISEDILTVEDREYLFSVIAGDVANEDSTLTYMLDESQTDDWKGSLNVDITRGEIRLITNNDDVVSKNDKIVVSVDDGGAGGKVYLEIILDLRNANDDPVIELPDNPELVYTQYEEIEIRPTFSDIDPGDVLTLDINMDHDIGEYTAVTDILSEADLAKGSEWTFSMVTGEFKFDIDDQDIWRSGDEMLDERVITLAFEVSDSGGGKDIVTIDLTLKDLNEAPLPPQINYEVYDEDPDTPGIQGYTVSFTSSEATDPDLDELTYKWDFGDGKSGEGMDVEHTYDSAGTFTVYLTVFDGEYTSDPASSVVQIYPIIIIDDPPSNGNDFNIFLVIIPVLIIVLIGGGIAAYFMLIRKPAGEEEVREEAAGEGTGSCPNCGASVKSDWFICPDCKKEL
ncbi:MAG: PKD domain-containing protein [Thermoplasmatota archaeon]